MNKEELIELKKKISKLKKITDVENILPNKMTAYSFLKECSKNRMNLNAINYLGKEITYGELIKKIDIISKSFLEFGVKPGEIVSMSMLTTPESIISFYALNKIGAIVHMINVTHSHDEIVKDLIETNSKVYIINDIFYSKNIIELIKNTNVDTVITSSLIDSLPYGFYGDVIKYNFLTNFVKIKNYKYDNSIKWNNFYNIGVNSNKNYTSKYVFGSPAAIAYTSGSTGIPKGIVTTNEAINALPVQLGMTDQTFEEKDSIFNSLPLWIYYSLINNTHNPLCLGVTLDLDPIFDPKQIHKRIRQYKFNHWNTIPTYLDSMVHDKKIKNMDLSFLKSITTGGDFLTSTLKCEAEDLLKNNNSNIYVGQGYGASELLGSFGYTYYSNMTPNSIGKPLVGNKFKILDLETKDILGPNESGELYLYSPAIMKGYYKNEVGTNKSIVLDEDGVRWYKTEDIAHYNENGELFIDGRMRRIEITKDDKGLPTKVFPDKIKKVILKHSFIEKCEIIMIDDPIRITKPVAFMVLKENCIFDNSLINEIKNICIENKLESYSIPAEFKIIDKMPLTPGLKVDLEQLKIMYNENQKKKIRKK